MNLRKLLLVSLVCFTLTPLYAMFNTETTIIPVSRYKAFRHKVSSARKGFIVGYATGLVPIAGQAFFPMMVFFGADDPNGNFGFFAGSAVVGHVAGIATIVIAAYLAYKNPLAALKVVAHAAGIATIATAAYYVYKNYLVGRPTRNITELIFNNRIDSNNN